VLLQDARAGNRETLDRLFPLVYDELWRIAHLRLLAEPAGHTLNTTALVHEAYLKLVDQTQVGWRDRAHFLAVASMAMRRILVDHARKHQAVKRGGERKRVPLFRRDDRGGDGRRSGRDVPHRAERLGDGQGTSVPGALLAVGDPRRLSR
jgi:RNA polymerase sigma factor (TIGR02999 family)